MARKKLCPIDEHSIRVNKGWLCPECQKPLVRGVSGWCCQGTDHTGIISDAGLAEILETKGHTGSYDDWRVVVGMEAQTRTPQA